MKKTGLTNNRNDFLSYYNKCINHLSSGNKASAISALQDGIDHIKSFLYDLISANHAFTNATNRLSSKYLRGYLDFFSLKQIHLDAVNDANKKVINNVNKTINSLDVILNFYIKLINAISILPIVDTNTNYHIVVDKKVLDIIDDLMSVLPKFLDWDKVNHIIKLKIVDLRIKTVVQYCSDKGFVALPNGFC